MVTGTLGGSIHGKHLSFTPRLAEAQWLVSHYAIRAMMDLSDGLGQDLPRLAEASQCGFEIELDSIPVDRQADGVDAAIGDGEDYELLFAVPPATARRIQSAWPFRTRLTAIGLLNNQPAKRSAIHGYDHFAKR